MKVADARVDRHRGASECELMQARLGELLPLRLEHLQRDRRDVRQFRRLRRMAWPAKRQFKWGHRSAMVRAYDKLADGKDPVMLAIPSPQLTIGQRQRSMVTADEQVVALVHPGVAPFSPSALVRSGARWRPAHLHRLKTCAGVWHCNAWCGRSWL